MTNRTKAKRIGRSGSSTNCVLPSRVPRASVAWVSMFVVAGHLASVTPARAQDMKPETRERVKQAAVMVFNAASKAKKGDTKLGSGSGYFINSTGMLITNNHVVDPGHGKSPEVKWKLTNQYNLLVQTVITDSGTEDEKEWECDLLYTNESADQALLQALDEDGGKLDTPNYLRFLPESRLVEGMKIVAMGFPGGDSRKGERGEHPEINVVDGHVLEIPRTPAGRVRMIFTDAELRAGNSGGPVVDVDGLLVGTLTLGFANEKRRNYNALVPGGLTQEFVRAAFDLGKVPGGGDVTPFMELLTRKGGRLDIPEFKRMDDRDGLFYDDGDIIRGELGSKNLTWESPLGKLDVPISAIAYIITNDEGAHLFMEGGNRVSSEDAAATFEFTPAGGTTKTLSFDDVQTIAFRAPNREPQRTGGTVIVLDSNLTHLRLTDVKGKVGFEGKMGRIDLALDDIARIDRNEDDEAVVILEDGRRMTGEFSDDKITAKLAMAGIPIEFSLNELSTVRIDVVEDRVNEVGGLGLAGVLAGADRQVKGVLKILESGDAKSALKRLTGIVGSKDFKKFPQSKKDRLRLLLAVATLRDGDAAAAPRLFRKCVRADEENVGAYASACSALLKRYDDYTFEGKPLTEMATFVAAGARLGHENIRRVRELLKDVVGLEGKTRGEYFKAIGVAKKSEESMKVAAIFVGEVGDDELIRLWKTAAEACRRELARIDQEVEEKRGGGRRGGKPGARKSRPSARSRGKGANLALTRELDALEEHREKVEETLASYLLKLRDYGFRIEDPDIQERRERQDDEGTGPNEGP